MQVPVLGFPQKQGRLHYLDSVSWLRDVVEDDLVIVSKPLLHSLGLALFARLGRRGLIVDVDDWQTGFMQLDREREGMSRAMQRLTRLRSYARRGGLNGFVLTRLLEEFARRWPHTTVSNRFLQDRFGGELLYHVRDPAILDPSRPLEHAIEPLPSSKLWVGFVGTPRPHKGIRILVDAIARAKQQAPLGLVLMGVDDPNAADIANARRILTDDALRVMPPFPLDALRDHLRLTDILAIPSLEVPSSRGQIPAKLFDAMSMGRPIVASGINDIPEILGDAGICVPPGDAEQLAQALVGLARDPGLRARLGRAARARLVEKYSRDAGRRVLVGVVQRAAR
jgi:glycosyltransferase involved in cell wall biosynthesis